MSGTATGEEITDDGFLDGRLKVLQPAKGYRAGLDAVLLAAAVPARAGERVLEAGAGVGVASLCLASRVSGLEVAGIELQPELVRLAGENISRNGFGDRISIVEGDIGHPVRDLSAMGLEPNAWHHVFANPPFHDPAASPASPNASKAQAHLTLGSDLDDWVRFACVMARPKGTVTFIHRAEALGDLLAAMSGHLGGIEVFPLWPAAGKSASRVIVRGQRGSRAPLALRPGLVLHGRDGRFTDRAEALLRRGEALLLDQPA
ncbi:MAG: methyltransferase [Parvibaculum sp.]|jgi:tRNA1(Val) A37 N6-methylase TrmN6|uniref:tRNA1(Val) (adenine(37)-N6)-methyltransferase n=1 Tax=Parvibaculum sp. TaxID=2024848 RepID=UPI000C461FD3|nr:methyltransferase [Parvibaculum sp.]MAU62090.1 methyltransferase [Parvibaculum sp.]HAC58136.1 methyltransferase [Rhodobiaceae bacterium]|tara:strand:+ start:4341 stop:5123 length:783 start_codon:yes stop_codon:yes gene_type:complete